MDVFMEFRMEDIEQWSIYVTTFKTGAEKKVQKRARMSSDLHCEMLDLSMGENITDLCKRKKMIKKTCSPRVSAEIPVIEPMDTAELMKAARQGKLDVIDKYLDDGGNPNVHDEGHTLGVQRGSLGVVKALRSKGADLNVRDKLYSTPLHVATRTGHTTIVEYLLSCCAKINCRDREGDTALHDAVHLNRYKIVNLLIDAGADTKIKIM
ncbi:hypothetical protein F7725_024056 [Dissostichus mawsoni]|uniref:Uncharacterized protein n=1 Tax=Dissostichus mawsoni TaxID=36200 RepID=A0A7J5XY86_DISMA|nr:hypothetical protein F7725_024056 [Dissostichus mawsoni]